MPIKLISLKCPNCGANLDAPGESKTFYCMYCGSPVYVDDGSEKLQVDARVSGDITAKVSANINLYDEAEMRRLDMEEKRRLRDEIEAYRKRWKKQVAALTLIVAVAGFIVGVSSGDESQAVPLLWGEGMGKTFLVAIPAVVFLFLRRPGRIEQAHNIGIGAAFKPNKDALLRMLDDDGQIDYNEYAKQWKQQLVAYPITVALLFLLLVFLIRIESWLRNIVSIDLSHSFYSVEVAIVLIMMALLVAGPIYLYLRRPSKYVQSYVRTANRKNANNDKGE